MDRTISELRKELDENKGRMGSMHDQIMELTDELYLAHEALKREFVHKGITEAVAPSVDKWRNIAGNLYDEMRLRGADCLYRHEDATNDCMNDYELADTQ